MGLKKGDLIVAVNNLDTYNMDMDYISNEIRGEEGTTVEIKVLRGTDEYLDFTVARQQIYIPKVTHEYIDDIAYIKILTFDGEVVEDFAKTLESLNTDKLIIDLRGNTGGVLESAKSLISYLTPSCTLGYIKYKNSVEVLDVEGLRAKDYSIVVLCDDATASCSELMVSALKENNLATILGTTTYGKNEIQEVFKVSDDSYLKLTVGEMLSINNESWQECGIEPDIIVEYSCEGSDLSDDAQIMEAVKYLKETI